MGYGPRKYWPKAWLDGEPAEVACCAECGERLTEANRREEGTRYPTLCKHCITIGEADLMDPG